MPPTGALHVCGGTKNGDRGTGGYASQVDRVKRLKNKLFLEVSDYVTRHIF